MPMIKANGCQLHVQVEGLEDAPALMLSNSLGTDLRMWDAQAAVFAKQFRLIRYDRRGHGRSEAPDGPYSMDMLGGDVIAILDALGIAKTHWCGLSMGGMVGMWLGANAPERMDRIVLSNTASHYEDKSPWNDRINTVTAKGIGAIAGPTMERWFTAGFRAREPQTIEAMKAMMLKTPVAGYLGCCAAVRDMDHREALGRIKAPTLVIAGRQDPATPLAASEYIAAHIPGSKLTVLEAAHISNIEQPQAYADAVLAHLKG